jgi:glycerate 2-kinase
MLNEKNISNLPIQGIRNEPSPLSDSGGSEAELAFEIFGAAISAVQPSKLIPQYLSADDTTIRIIQQRYERKEINRFIIIAAGKAAAAMAQAAEQQLGNVISDGICITKYDHALPLQHMRTIEAAHPVPDEMSLLAGAEVLKLVEHLKAKDIVLVLLSGGASSLLADVPDGCSLTDLQTTFDLLLKSGASIHEMNAVRKHLSKIKGGQLAKAVQPAKLFTLVLSDVVGDDAGTIGSGPTVADDTTFEEVHAVVNQHGIWKHIPSSVQQYIVKGIQHQIAETPKPAESYFQQENLQIIGNNQMALLAAAAKAEALGYKTVIANDNVQADAAHFAETIIHQYKNYNGAKPACILFGGETTVKVNGKGKGGRNQHLVLSALLALMKNKSLNKITILSAGTDGTDGTTNAAGAVADNYTRNFYEHEIEEHLKNFDAFHFFQRNGGLITTGATQTNVMDIMLLLIN